MNPARSAFMGNNEVVKNSRLETLKALGQAEKSQSFEQRDPLLLLAADNSLRASRLIQTLPEGATRFFLEGEGYGNFMVQKSVTPFDLVHGTDPLPLAHEPPGSRLREYFKECHGIFCIPGGNGKGYELRYDKKKLVTN